MIEGESVRIEDIALVHPKPINREPGQLSESDFGDYLYWKAPVDELEIRRRAMILQDIEREMTSKRFNSQHKPDIMEFHSSNEPLKEPHLFIENMNTNHQIDTSSRAESPKRETKQFDDENFIREGKHFILPSGEQVADISHRLFISDSRKEILDYSYMTQDNVPTIEVQGIPNLNTNRFPIQTTVNETTIQNSPANQLSNPPTVNRRMTFTHDENGPRTQFRESVIQASRFKSSVINNESPVGFGPRKSTDYIVDSNISLLTPPKAVSREHSTADKNELVPLGSAKMQSTFVLIDETSLIDLEGPKMAGNKTKVSIWRLAQLLRAISLFILTLVQYLPALQDPAVIRLEGRGLVIAVCVFSGFDVMFETMKCWPKVFWCFWDVGKWDSVLNF